MRVLLLSAESFENTVDGKRLSVIVKCLAVGALQQLKMCTQIAAGMVYGLVCSCVPSRIPVQSVYPTVEELLCPFLDLPLRPGQLKGHLSPDIAAFVGALRDPSRLAICVYFFWPFQTKFSAGFAFNEGAPISDLDTLVPALILRRFRSLLCSLHLCLTDAGYPYRRCSRTRRYPQGR